MLLATRKSNGCPPKLYRKEGHQYLKKHFKYFLDDKKRKSVHKKVLFSKIFLT